jgi:3-phosphoshikimate 1-carboxyvinyltransferase
MEIFTLLGVETVFTNQGAILKKTSIRIEKLEENFTDIPDLVQTFAVTCALLNIPFCFTGLQNLKIKETDRITALVVELGKLGYLLQEKNENILLWNGERNESPPHPIIETYEDHRMAMSFAPAAIRYPNMRIAHPHVVTKSYPCYWEDLKKAGVIILNDEIAN